MQGKICVVTGGNAGIGYEIVKGLAQLGATVFLVSRNRERGQTAIQQIKTDQPQADVTLVVGDVGSIASTQALAHEITKRTPHIDVLVNNAGVWPTEKKLNPDGLEVGFMVNYLATFMLSHLLYDHLVLAEQGRVIHVSAGLYIKGKFDLEKTPVGADFGRIKTYCSTKLAGVLTLPHEVASFAGTNVTVNMVHPGVVNTSLGEMGGVLGWLMRQVKKKWMTPAQGAVAPIWLATAPELAATTGVYYNEKEVMAFDPIALDADLAANLWRWSFEKTGLNVRSTIPT